MKKIKKFVKPLDYTPETCPVCEAYRMEHIHAYCPKHRKEGVNATGTEIRAMGINKDFGVMGSYIIY